MVPVREQHIPTVGTLHSHLGNVSFPYWEQIPLHSNRSVEFVIRQQHRGAFIMHNIRKINRAEWNCCFQMSIITIEYHTILYNFEKYYYTFVIYSEKMFIFAAEIDSNVGFGSYHPESPPRRSWAKPRQERLHNSAGVSSMSWSLWWAWDGVGMTRASFMLVQGIKEILLTF